MCWSNSCYLDIMVMGGLLSGDKRKVDFKEWFP